MRHTKVRNDDEHFARTDRLLKELTKIAARAAQLAQEVRERTAQIAKELAAPKNRGAN